MIRHRMKGRRVYQSPAYPMSDEALYERCAREFDHMYYPEGGPSVSMPPLSATGHAWTN